MSAVSGRNGVLFYKIKTQTRTITTDDVWLLWVTSCLCLTRDRCPFYTFAHKNGKTVVHWVVWVGLEGLYILLLSFGYKISQTLSPSPHLSACTAATALQQHVSLRQVKLYYAAWRGSDFGPPSHNYPPPRFSSCSGFSSCSLLNSV